MPRLRLALCQIDTVVGDVAGNAERIVAHLRQAEQAGADLAAFPELALTGYPPEDLLLKPAFVADNLLALHQVAQSSGPCAAVVGYVDVIGDVGSAVSHASGTGRVTREDAVRGSRRRLRNAVAVCASGAVVGRYHKRRLPNYGVFDEERWFAPGTDPLQLFEVNGVAVGIAICEDLWLPEGPVAELAAGGAAVVVVVNASPYSLRRTEERLDLVRRRAAEAGCAIAYVNQVGGQDELVFDGASLVVLPGGEVVAAGAAFDEDLVLVDLPVAESAGSKTLEVVHLPGDNARTPPAALSTAPRGRAGAETVQLPLLDPDAEVYAALRLGTHDYLAKNGFTDAVIGLSGGIDSSLVAAIAVDALGPEHVHGVAMPSRYSSAGSVSDAEALAGSLGIDLAIVPIEPVHQAFATMLAPVLGGPPRDLTDENLQSRLRGVALMALSNARGWIVLTTGNKSELATGYSTLYGDSAGGFAVIKDVPKTLVYRLCRYRNALAGRDIIPRSVLDKPPSAELRPDQRDDESLPPYELLDPVLAGLVEDDLSVADLVEAGYDAEVVARVARLVDLAEYKRRQSPPGVRITARAFGKDRRMPITNQYRFDAKPAASASVPPPAAAVPGTP